MVWNTRRVTRLQTKCNVFNQISQKDGGNNENIWIARTGSESDHNRKWAHIGHFNYFQYCIYDIPPNVYDEFCLLQLTWHVLLYFNHGNDSLSMGFEKCFLKYFLLISKTTLPEINHYSDDLIWDLDLAFFKPIYARIP